MKMLELININIKQIRIQISKKFILKSQTFLMKAFQAENSFEDKSFEKNKTTQKDNSDNIIIDLEEQSEEDFIKNNNINPSKCKKNNILKFKNNKNKKQNINKISKCRWTKEEEKLLFYFIQKYKKDWDLIASFFPDKSRDQCYTKYSKLITNFKKGKWTEQEDDLIVELLNKFDFNWKMVAVHYKDRSLTQIKQRYYNSLDPKINKGKFSDAEDDLLIKKFKVFGADWKRIAVFFADRPSNLIKNRYYTRKRNEQKSKCLFCFVKCFLFCFVFF